MRLFDYQSHDINNVWWKQNGGRGILGWSVGTGKTFTGAHITAVLLIKGMIDRAIIVCPPALIETWKEQLAMNDIEYSTYTSRKKEQGQITIVTYDLLKHISVSGKTLLIGDECHKIKNSASKRGKTFKNVSRISKYLLMMTGTLSQNRDPEEFLNYLLSIGVDEMPKNITAYRREYSVWRGNGALKFPVSTRQGRELINKHMKRYTSFRTLRSVRDDIPPYNEFVVKTASGLSFKKIAEKMLKERGLDEEVNDENRPHLIHALQASNGINPFTKKLENRDKLNAVLEYIESFGNEKIIVWGWWREFLKELHYTLGDKSVVVAGWVSDKMKAERIEQFRNNTKTQILIASLGSVSEGLNLQFCSNVIIANQWFDIVQDTQSRGRVERIGQQNNITAVRLVAKGTLEEYVVKALKQKKGLTEAKAFLNGILNRRYGI